MDLHVHVDEPNNLDVDCDFIIHEVLDASFWISSIFAKDGGLSGPDQRLEHSSLLRESVLEGVRGALAIGQTIPSAGKNSVAIGHSLTGVGRSSVNIGSRNVTQKYAIALGSGNTASGSQLGVAIGTNNRASGGSGWSVALGKNVSSGKFGVSIGAENVGGTQAIVIGSNNNATGSSSSARSVIVGYNNQVNGQNTSQITVGISNRSNTRVNIFGQNNTNNQNVTIFGSGNTNSIAPTSGSSANNINESIIFGFANKITSRSGLAYGKNNTVPCKTVFSAN